MSRKKLTARDKLSRKNTRNGVVERNETIGEDIRVSKREADFDIREKTPEKETLSKTSNLPGQRFGRGSGNTRPDNKSGTHKKAVQRHNKTLTETKNTEKEGDNGKHELPYTSESSTATVTAPDTPRQQALEIVEKPRDPPMQPDSGSKKLFS